MQQLPEIFKVTVLSAVASPQTRNGKRRIFSLAVVCCVISRLARCWIGGYADRLNKLGL